MAYPPKFLTPDTGPSTVKVTDRSDYEATKYESFGMVAVGNREGIGADTIELNYNQVSSGFRDTIVTLFNNTHGGIEFFGLIPPPSGTSRTPPAIGAERGQFSADWNVFEAAVRNWQFVDGPSSTSVVYSSSGASLQSTAATTGSTWCAMELAPKLWPNLIYRLDYTISGGGTLKLSMNGTWLDGMPYTGTFVQTQAQGAGSANVDGIISLDISSGTKSLYFVVPEYGNTTYNAFFLPGQLVPGRFRIFTPAEAYGGTVGTVLESATLTQVGSLYRFNSLDITKNSNAAYTIKVQLQENLATHMGSRTRNRQ